MAGAEDQLRDQLREAYKAHNSGDVRVLLALFDDEFEWREPPDAPEGDRIYRGFAEIMQLGADRAQGLVDARYEVERMIDANNRIVVLFVYHAVGRTTGVPVAERGAHVWRLGADRFTSLDVHKSWADALTAAAVAPPADIELERPPAGGEAADYSRPIG